MFGRVAAVADYPAVRAVLLIGGLIGAVSLVVATARWLASAPFLHAAATAAPYAGTAFILTSGTYIFHQRRVAFLRGEESEPIPYAERVLMRVWAWMLLLGATLYIAFGIFLWIPIGFATYALMPVAVVLGVRMLLARVERDTKKCPACGRRVERKYPRCGYCAAQFPSAAN